MEKRPLSPYAISYDLTNCDSEPLRFISTVQAHAALLVCQSDDLKVIQASNNCPQALGLPLKHILSKKPSDFLPASEWEKLNEALKQGVEYFKYHPVRLGMPVNEKRKWFNCLVHIQDEFTLLEFEPFETNELNAAFQNRIGTAIQRIQSEMEPEAVFQITAHEVKKITGYDRVMVYRFLKDDHGTVIAEAKEQYLEPFLGLHYPASDIPQQARDLYLKNPVRIISDVKTEPAYLHPPTNPILKRPTNLSQLVSRGVSPIHLEYLANMGVQATMSIAIIFENKLWGLVACHHYASGKFTGFLKRNSALLLSRIISGHLGLQLAHDFRRSVLEANIMKSKLFEQMAADWDIIQGLTEGEYTLLHLNDCSGAAIFYENQLKLLGDTPKEAEVEQLIQWLDERKEESLFVSDELSAEYPNAMNFKDKAAGLLSIRLAKSPGNYILWFRPEAIKTVDWGGNPDKALIKSKEGVRLSPRKSFEKWSQQVANTSKPWKQYEIDTAMTLRSDVKDFIFQKYQEVKQFNQELTDAYEELESFSYSVSHDLRAPLRSIDGFANILKEDYGEQLDEDGNFLLDTIIQSAGKLSNFIDDILAYSRMSNRELKPSTMPLKGIFREVIKDLVTNKKYNQNKVEINLQSDMPELYADRTMLRQLILNVLSNALKYSRLSDPPKVEISGGKKEHSVWFQIKDNGIGFDMKFVDKIFGVFNRLVSEDEDYEGTGVGMAIVKRIADRHEAAIEIESEPGKGSSFRFIFPQAEMNII